MPSSFPRIAFSPGVKAQQAHYGSRRQYERTELVRAQDFLGPDEFEFIARRDGFYLATASESGQPYVQYRGGPPGFLKSIDADTLAYADFRGNRQYISTGNLAENDRAALILMDYPNRRRLKVLATVEIRDAAADPDLAATLAQPDYPAIIERVVLLRVQGFDWNCPQHITPRFSLEELESVTAPLHARIAELEEKVRRLGHAGPSHG
jgi:predicted pyridoxine 5'-phosphate oxidase superfamily flavin-nucleotide-binding protein